MHTAYQMLYKPTLKKQKLNVINYKYETHALAIHLKLEVGRFKCASAYDPAYNLKHLLFAVFERLLIQHWINCMQFFLYNTDKMHHS